MAGSTQRAPRGSRLAFLLFLLLLLAVFALSLQPRIRQYAEWTSNPDRHFAGRVSVASADSYYLFRMARAQRDGVAIGDVDPLRDFPDGKEYRGMHAMSRAMAALSGWLGGDVYRAGIFLTILFSSLFVLPLGLYWWRVGLPAAGLLGALVGSFSPAYFHRTGIDRVDTDGGNQFFVWLIALSFALVSPERSRNRNLALAAVAGLCVALFCWWYDRYAFLVVYAGAFAFTLVVVGFRGRRALALFAVMLLFANPLQLVEAFGNFRHLAENYVFTSDTLGDEAQGEALQFPNITEDIDDFKLYSAQRTLANLVRNPALSLLGLVGFVLVLVFRFRVAVPLLPIVAFASPSFLRSNRYTMYLAPLAGIGWGWLLTVLVDSFFRIPALRARRDGLAPQIAVYAVALGGFALLLPQTAYDASPRPHVKARLIASLQGLRDAIPDDAAIWHSWSYGFLITDVTGRATFNDGEFPDPIVEQLLAHAVTGADPRLLHDVAGFVAGRGRAAVGDLAGSAESYSGMLEQMVAARQPLDRPVVLLLTDRMLHEFPVLYRWGQWDFEKLSGPSDEGYVRERCRRVDSRQLSCAVPGVTDAAIDLERGLLGGRPVVKKLVRVGPTGVVEEVDYPNEGPIFLQVLEGEGGELLAVQMMREPVFRSTFNQMFVLGRYDRSLFTELYHDFPVSRAFQLAEGVARETIPRASTPAGSVPNARPASPSSRLAQKASATGAGA